MFELVFQEDGQEHVVPIHHKGITLGRSPDCDIVIKDFGVSRLHAKAVLEGVRCYLVDLKSKNGTTVNGVPVLKALLDDGDQILLGKFLVSVRRILEERVVLDDEKLMLDAEGTVIRSVGDLKKYLTLETELKETFERPEIPFDSKEDRNELGKTNRILRSLSGLAQALISAQPEDVPARVMDTVFEHIPADRGFLMLYDEEGNLRPRVVQHRRGDDDGRITISKTIAERVVKDRVAILTSDAQVDPRFSTGDSIRFHGIRSAMCAPLWRGEEVIGIIHIDSPMQSNTFTMEELDLLSALANYAAIAIQQANLNKKVREEKVSRERLEKYFSPKIVTRILSEGGKENHQELEVTVIFADIIGFTSMLEKMNPPQVALILNEYFSSMADVIREFDGVLDKFIGDCIMAVFGAPYPQEDHAERAVQVAIEMRHRLNELNSDREPDEVIEMRMGINSGRVFAGPIGSTNRKEMTVLGDAVNIASRIESTVAQAGQIVVGERTQKLIQGKFGMKDLGIVELKGKQQSVRVYEIL